MKYCYSKTFVAGETVTVPGYGASNDSQDSAIFIIWDDAEANGAGYVVENGEVIANADTFAADDDANTREEVITAIYDETGAMTDVAFGNASIDVGEIEEDDQRIIGMFVTDLKNFEPRYTKKAELKIFREETDEEE